MQSLRRDLSIKRGLRAKKLAEDKPTAARGSEEGGAKCICDVHTEFLEDYDMMDDEIMSET